VSHQELTFRHKKAEVKLQ